MSEMAWVVVGASLGRNDVVGIDVIAELEDALRWLRHERWSRDLLAILRRRQAPSTVKIDLMNVSSSADTDSVLTPAEPMEIGTVIATAWRLYRVNFKPYVMRSLYGSVWLIFPMAILLAGVLWMLHAELTVNDLEGPLALLIPAWIVLFLWCNAQSLGELSAISRLAYRRLKTPPGLVVETMPEALRFTRSRKFSLLGSAVIQWLVLGVVSALLFISALFSIGLIFVGVGLVTGQPNSRLFLSGGALFIGSLILFGGLLLWLSVRFLVTEQALAIEKDSGAIASIGRSWKLMKKNVLRTVGALILAGLVCLPIFLVMFVSSQITQSVVLQMFDAVPSPATPPPVAFLSFIASLTIGSLIGMLGGIITNPFVRVVVTTLYFDIRNRKESIEA